VAREQEPAPAEQPPGQGKQVGDEQVDAIFANRLRRIRKVEAALVGGDHQEFVGEQAKHRRPRDPVFGEPVQEHNGTARIDKAVSARAIGDDMQADGAAIGELRTKAFRQVHGGHRVDAVRCSGGQGGTEVS
jgi:hypothetical protein